MFLFNVTLLSCQLSNAETVCAEHLASSSSICGCRVRGHLLDLRDLLPMSIRHRIIDLCRSHGVLVDDVWMQMPPVPVRAHPSRGIYSDSDRSLSGTGAIQMGLVGRAQCLRALPVGWQGAHSQHDEAQVGEASACFLFLSSFLVFWRSHIALDC